MSFDLRVTITGMCLFVPDERTGSGPMRLLLPDMSDHLNHDARLLFDRGYLTPGAFLQRDLQCISLDRKLLSLPGSGLSLRLPREIPNLGFTGASVKASVLQTTPAPREVKSHVVFEGGAVSDYELGAEFDFPGNSGLLTFQVDWTVRGLTGTGGNDRLDWRLVSLDDEMAVTYLPTLFPVGGVVHVLIYHTPTNELPGARKVVTIPPGGTEASHFRGYYKLATGGTVTTGPLVNQDGKFTTNCSTVDSEPEDDEDAGGGDAEFSSFAAGRLDVLDQSEEPSRGGSPFTCMPALAPIG
jgi:hypothetical protein